MDHQIKSLLLALLAYAGQRDLPVDKLLRMSNMTVSQLKDAGEPITSKQVTDVWNNIVDLSQDKLFGLHFGESLQLSALGIVGEIIKTFDTVGSALTYAASLTDLVTDAFEMELSNKGDKFVVYLKPLKEDWSQQLASVQTLYFLLVFVIHELDGLLLKKIKPDVVYCNFLIEDRREFERVMRCQDIQKASYNAIEFDRQYWGEPIITANHQLQQVLLKLLAVPITTVTEKQSLKTRVYHYLISNSYLGIVSLESLAGNFNISGRTLQRKLKAERVSFQQISDEARKNLAINYLEARVHSIKEISYMLGYNETTAFIRAFKKWTGCTPAEYTGMQ